MIPDVSEHALSRYCERIVGKPAAELSMGERVFLRDHIAASASLPRRMRSVANWRKCTEAAVYIVKDGIVATVITRAMHSARRAWKIA